LLKPRFEASATGIRKIREADELWPALDTLGDRQCFHVIERYVPGDIYHVDSIVYEGQVLFAAVNRYGHPPLDVAHGGGIFTTRTCVRGTRDETALQEINRTVLGAMRLPYGVSHTEFIKGREDGEFYFLETAARVGGANIVELVEAATGINLWREWAKIEIAGGKPGGYQLRRTPRLPRAREVPGHFAIRRPRDRVAHEQRVARRFDRQVAGGGARRVFIERLLGALLPRFPRRPPAK
jgi:biotin carboxylase